MAGLMASAMMFASCSSDGGDSNDGTEKNEQAEAEAKAKAEAEAKEEAAKEAEKKQVREFYESIMGEWEEYWRDDHFYLVLGKELITYTIYRNNEMLSSYTLSTDPINDITIDLNDSPYIYNISHYQFCLKDGKLDFSNGRLLTRVKSSSGTGGSGSSGSEGGENISVKGTYAGYDRYNSSITMNDNGTWTFDTSKPGSAVSGGTYTVSGNKITMKYTARGTDFEETFTVTNSGSQSTWKTSQNGASTLFSTLFMEVGTEYTFIKS